MSALHPSARTAVRLVPAILALPLLLAACGGDDSDSPTAEDTRATVGCTYTEGGQAERAVELPPADAPTGGLTAATIATDQGDIPVELDTDNAPCTVNSFLSLADQGFFDDTQCHRLTTSGIFVLQCGDPSATGMGGPGYSFPDELSGEETYGPGTLAMANAGPDTNGSQFFIVYGDSPLDPDYTVFGQIDDSGLEVVNEIAAAGAAQGAPDGPPATPVTIESVTVD